MDNNALLDYVEENEELKQKMDAEINELTKQNSEMGISLAEKLKKIELHEKKEKEYFNKKSK